MLEMQMMGLAFIVSATNSRLIVRETEPRYVASGSFHLMEQGVGLRLRCPEGSAM